ncbi:hypothetical protein [Streptomyces sp. B6B3]|uniref:hypothetical protein n=1 Tax=Streptomyces sp. B6B3 TaxID=3153570 RepID=UPI00325DB731
MHGSADIRLSSVVMTHPRRSGLAQKLVERLHPEAVTLVLDPRPDGPPTGLRTAIQAWSRVPADATHHLVLQDDAVPVDDFFTQVRAAARAVPDAALAFYAHWQSRNAGAVRLAALAGRRWAPAMPEYTPTMALLLPAEIAAGFAPFAREHGATWADDVVMSRYLRQAGVSVYVSAPNLVDHADEPSIHANGGSGPRRSACLAPTPTKSGAWTLTAEDADPDSIPFFKQGRAQVVTRVSPDEWTTLSASRYLARIGLAPDSDTEALAALIDDPAPGTTRLAGLKRRVAPALLEAHWRTAYLMGVVNAHERRHAPDAEAESVMTAALATLGPGGLCTRLDDASLSELEPALLELSRAGYHLGQRVGRRLDHGPSGPRRGVGRGRLLLRDAVRRLASPLARGLADQGWEVWVDLERPGDAGRPVPDDAVAPYPGVHPYVPARSPATFTSVVEIVDGAGPRPRPTDAADGSHRLVLLTAPEGTTPDRPGTVPAGHTVLLLGDVYGPGVRSDSALGLAVRDALLCQPVRWRGRHDALWQPVYVDDVAQAVHHAAGGAAAGTSINLRASPPLSSRALADAVVRSVRRVPLALPPAATAGPHPPDTPSVPERAPELPGWPARTGLEDGLHAWSQWIAYEEPPSAGVVVPAPHGGVDGPATRRPVSRP